jgi:WD40 repeat protein
MFVTSSADKTVRLWDMRSPECAASIEMEGEVNAACSMLDDSLIACGTGTSVVFVDVLSRRQLGRYSDCHTGDVMCLSVCPSNPNVLASGADDGLICVYDVSAGASQEAVVSILNTECCVGKFGFFGTGYEGLFCVSTVETFSLWHFPSAQRIHNFGDVRELSRAWPASVDYLVGCTYVQDTDTLQLVTGTHEGTVVLCNVTPDSLQPVQALTDGHRSTVRCVDGHDGWMVTGGEDARLALWTAGAIMETSGSGVPVAPRITVKQRQYKPY